MHLSKPLANRTEGQCCCGSHKSIGSYIPLPPCLSSSCWRSFQVQIQSVGHTSIYEKHSIISSVLSLSTVFTPLFEAEKQSSCAAYSSYNSSDSLRHRVVSTVLGVTLLWKKIDAFPPWLRDLLSTGTWVRQWQPRTVTRHFLSSFVTLSYSKNNKHTK